MILVSRYPDKETIILETIKVKGRVLYFCGALIM